MLPSLVRTWWEQHELAGRVDVPLLTYTPPTESQPASFKGGDVSSTRCPLAVHPNEWMSRDEISTLQNLRRTGCRCSTTRYHAVGLYRMTNHTPAADIAPAVGDGTDPACRRVSGTFVFTDKGIEIKNAGARIENNSIQVSGRIDGYSPDSPLAVAAEFLRGARTW